MSIAQASSVADNTDGSSAPSQQATRSRAVRVGFTVFAVGLLFLSVTVLPFFWGDDNRSLWLNIGCMLAPIGFVIAIVGVVRAGRADQRAALTAIE
ncbi:hypothetical protein ACSMXN_02710 [Jatrophihabitans sp. DSM 45814]